MKSTLLKTVSKLQEDNIDLSETPALFTWSYDEEPNIEFQMLIIEVNPEEDSHDVEDNSVEEFIGHTLQ